MSYWTIPESSLATIAACLPTLRPIFHGHSPETIINYIRSHISLPWGRALASTRDMVPAKHAHGDAITVQYDTRQSNSQVGMALGERGDVGMEERLLIISA